MHGPAVASLLVGETCGTAPGAKVYYAAAPSWTKDTAYQARALEWIIEQNRQLPQDRKIKVVSVSAAPSGSGSLFTKNQPMWDEACRKAEAEGMLVLDCTQHRGLIGPGFFEKTAEDDPASCRAGFPPDGFSSYSSNRVCVPTCPRTTAEETVKGEFSYIYWGEGGLSWAIPYAAGVLAMGWQVWPEATPEQMKELLFETAYFSPIGAKIIHPVKFKG